MSLPVQRLLVPALLLLAGSIAADAAEFRLRDGTVVQGAFIGEADDTLTVLTVEGKLRRLDRAEVIAIDWHQPVAKKLEKRANRERKKFIKKRRSRARVLMKHYGRAEPSEREEIARELDRFSEHELYPALDEALRSRRPATRDFAFSRLRRFESSGAVVPFVRTALASDDGEYARRCHQAALDTNEVNTRRVYEYVAERGAPADRIKAMNALGSIQSQKSVPTLIRVLVYVQSNIRIQFARGKGIKEVPVNLGGGATQVPIELPEIELIEVMTTTRVPVEVLRRVEVAAIETLEAISKQNLGDSPQAWEEWWRARAVKD